MRTRLILGALPLLIYPFVALASIMSLAAQTTGSEPMPLLLVARGFQITSLLYPAIYFSALIAALVLRKKKEPASRIASIPLWYLAFVVLLFAGWIGLEVL